MTTKTLALAVMVSMGCEHKDKAPAPSADPVPAPTASAAPASTKVDFPEVPIRAGADTTVRVAWKVPAGTNVNDEAPFKVRWNRSDALAEAPADVKSTGSSAQKGFDIVVKPLAGAPNATLGGVIDLVVCDAVNHSVCLPVRRTVDIEFVVGASAAPVTTVTIPLPQAH